MVGAGADDLILLCARTYLGPGQPLGDHATDLRPVPARDELQAPSTEPRTDGATVIWRCNPNNPTGAVTPAAELVELARANPGAVGRRRRGVRRVRRRERDPVARRAPESRRRSGRCRRPSGSRRCGSATRSRAPDDRGGARAAARARADRRARRGASRPLRCGSRASTSTRRSPSASGSVPRSPRPATTARRRATNFVWLSTRRRRLAAGLERQGVIVRTFADGLRITLRGAADDDVLLRALGAGPAPLARVVRRP